MSTADKFESSFGKILKNYRQASGTSMTSLARSLNVSKSYLSKLEHDASTPSRGFIKKIITVLNLSDNERSLLKRFAGYGEFASQRIQSRIGVTVGMEKEKMVIDENLQPRNSDNSIEKEVKKVEDKKVNVEIKLDPNKTPILYTDSIFISSNKLGLVLNVAQSMGPIPQQNIVARIGMSKQHAQELLEVLNKHLLSGVKKEVKIS